MDRSLISRWSRIVVFTIASLSFRGQTRVPMPVPRSRKALLILLSLAVLLLGRAVAEAQNTPSGREGTFYYFNPDSPQSNIARLKREMDAFLRQIDFSLSFTPFARFNDFNHFTRKAPPNLVLLPRWYWEEKRDDMQLVPLLAPVRNGSASYRKLLLVPRHSDLSLEDLSKKTLAMTFMGGDCARRLNRLFFSRHGITVDTLNVVVTPKDSDALFALVLGQVDMALVSEENLVIISRANPKIGESVKTLVRSAPIPLPVLCYRKGTLSREDIDQVKRLFLGSDKRRNTIMEMLQFDGWQEYIN